MLTLHLNGEIVRHADLKEVAIRRKERYDREKRCKYGVKEVQCEPYVYFLNNNVTHKDVVKSVSQWNGCELGNCTICPQYKTRKLYGSRKKEYSLTWETYRKLSSAAHYIVKESNYKTLFLTLTFPKFKKNEITEQQANECFSKFAENLKTNYNCEHYLAVRENGSKNGRLHFHLVISMPYVRFDILNNAWNHAIQDFCYFSKSAIQSDGSNRVIKNPSRAVRYICKYISKSFGQKSRTRLYFISNSALRSLYVNPETGEVSYKSNLKRTLSEYSVPVYELLKDYKGIYINQCEYVTVFKITDYKSFNKFCLLVLYPLFDLENRRPECGFNPVKS